MTHDMDCAIVEELFSDLLLSPPWTPGSDCCMGQVGDDGRPLYGKTIYCDSDGRVKAINLGQGSHTPFQSDQSANQIIVGPIPPSLWQLNLTALYLDQNQFSGDISPLSNMTNLVEVDLSNNAFATTFPDLSGLTRLESLWMNHNTMAGSVPPSFLAPNLIEIDLSYNLFCGPLPQFRNEDTLEYCDFRYSGLCLTSPYIMMGCIQPLILCLGNTSCASPGPTGTGGHSSCPVIAPAVVVANPHNPSQAHREPHPGHGRLDRRHEPALAIRGVHDDLRAVPVQQVPQFPKTTVAGQHPASRYCEAPHRQSSICSICRAFVRH
ncbi:uncharacterized protein BJ171DRAFT_303577 [Polychytrium aggregatum]|uniref:uncharacterized protein n=1 Tax=Polychytrium aggregatum TaxID=110093 RepID=UPI0022FE6C14|nr:uncharacterized protein BJ171DRAFT_303577 [Polychytrium aggregatum]KAI9193140.1 hypothetical protein BJ171DRAFT_303577 [Polychytrium aggregatum]